MVSGELPPRKLPLGELPHGELPPPPPPANFPPVNCHPEDSPLSGGAGNLTEGQLGCPNIMLSASSWL